MSGCWEDEALRYLGFFSPSSKSGYMPYVTIPLCSVLPVRVVSVQHCFGSDHTDLLTGSADVQLHDEDKDNAISVSDGREVLEMSCYVSGYVSRTVGILAGK